MAQTVIYLPLEAFTLLKREQVCNPLLARRCLCNRVPEITTFGSTKV